jgi:peptidoglycan hydrolase CwlO-like protein
MRGNPLARTPKALLPVILVVIAVAALGMTLAGRIQENTRLKQDLDRRLQELARLQAEREDLLGQVESLQAANQEKDERISSLRTQLSSLSADVENVRTTFGELQARYEKMAVEREQLQTQLASTSSERDSAQQRLKQIEGEHAELERLSSRLRERLSLLDRDYQQLSQKFLQVEALHRQQETQAMWAPNPAVPSVDLSGSGGAAAPAASPTSGQAPTSSIPGTVELPPIIVQNNQVARSIPVRGRLVDVNDTHNFVIVDKGSLDGVRVGMSFDIMRGNGAVGRVMAVRVRPQLTACDIVRPRTPGPVQVGDLAIQSGS